MPVPACVRTHSSGLTFRYGSGTALGARRGLASLGLYAVAGMAGMPWFAEGASGWSMPTL
ncbi:biotin transporter BioY, partial [Streptomyces sp. NPDC004726]